MWLLSTQFLRSEGSIRQPEQLYVEDETVSLENKRCSKTKLSTSTHPLLVRWSWTGPYSASNLREPFSPEVLVRRIQKLLAEEPMSRWARARRSPPPPSLARPSAKNLYNWAEEHLLRGASHWYRTTFSDEKRFSLDGPGGLASYWRDTSVGKIWSPSRQNVGVG